jgi:integrase/recombinase XerD
MLEGRRMRPFLPARAPIEAGDERIIDLLGELPSPAAFLRRVARELRRQGHPSHTRKAYRASLARFLRWNGVRPHRTGRRDVERYLAFLQQGGATPLEIGQALAALKTAFDRFAGTRVAGSAERPAPPRTLPPALEPFEVVRVVRAAASPRDKLMLALMYATGSRMSDIARLRWRDLDRARGTTRLWQCRRHRDRELELPQSLALLVRHLGDAAGKNDLVYVSGTSPIAEMFAAFDRALRIAKIRKLVTPGTMRRSLAVHLVANACDVRFVHALFRAPLEIDRACEGSKGGGHAQPAASVIGR